MTDPMGNVTRFLTYDAMGNLLAMELAYIDLNPVRAGLVERPEDYRWNSIGYHIQTNNKDDFLSLGFGLREFGEMDDRERLRRYRRFLYETGAVEQKAGDRPVLRSSYATEGEKSEVGSRKKQKNTIEQSIVEKERENDFELTRARRFRYRTRYFTDSGIIGGKVFVLDTYRKVKATFQSKRDKIPKPIAGLAGIYSLKRLME